MKTISIIQIYSHVVGIDVSKQSLDVCLINCSTGQHFHKCFSNNSEGFIALKKWLIGLGNDAHSSTLFCMEHTGIYTRNLVKYLLAREAKVWVESSLHIKKCMGLVRGKSDKIDSLRIATFAWRYQSEAVLMELHKSSLGKLKDLNINRIRLKKSLQSLTVPIKEMKQIEPSLGKVLEKVNKQAISGIEASLKKIENLIQEIIDEDENLKRLFTLITSIKGVGPVMATELIVYTNGFTRMNDARKLACYCGVAPFEYSSGTSVRGGTHTSSFANKLLKHTLHMCAMNSIKYNKDLKGYYKRKVKEGKKKMSALNAVRNKLLHTIVAIVNRGTPYVENYKNVA